jgi:adenosylcobyric acid synthase
VSGIEELRLRTGVPVLGVIPFQENLQLGQEDSMGFGEEELPPATGIRIGVVRLPHLSNGNDWTALQSIAGVAVFCSADPHKLSQADALIVPGTRSTIEDLRWLKACGLSELITNWVRAKLPLLAICGGMQMLGETVCDKDGVESVPGSQEEGLHVFALRTVLERQGKIVRQRRELVTPSVANKVPWLKTGNWIEGYEIHCGRSEMTMTSDIYGQEWLDGLIANQGMLWGTYWHGVFHQSQIAQAWVQAIAEYVGKNWNYNHSDSAEIDAHVPGFLRAGITVAQQMLEKHVRWQELLP